MSADTLERLAPETVMIMRDGTATREPVIETIAYPPSTAPEDAPIVRTMHVLELRTPRGSRWYGFTSAPWNGSDLRMHVLLDNDRDETRMAWETP